MRCGPSLFLLEELLPLLVEMEQPEEIVPGLAEVHAGLMRH
jgi:hypothetical protein